MLGDLEGVVSDLDFEAEFAAEGLSIAAQGIDPTRIGRPLRDPDSVAFDPKRCAILLVAGDKSRDWARWYKRHIQVADQRFGVRGAHQARR